MVRSIARRLIQWEIIWLFMLTPFLFFPTPRRTLGLLVIPLLWVVRKVAWGRFVPRTPLDWPLFFLLLMVGVSLWATFDPLFSLPKVTGVLLGVAFFYGLVSYVRWYGQLWLPLAVLIVVTCGITGLSLVGTSWAGKFPLFGPIIDRLPQVLRAVPGSPAGGFNPNSVAGALLFALPLLGVMAWPFPMSIVGHLPLKRVLRGLLYLLLLGALGLVAGLLILSQSRGGYLGFLVGMGALLFLPRPRLLLLVLIFVALSVGGGVWYQPDLVASYFSEGTEVAAQAQSGANSLQGRIEIWSRALYGIQDFPFTGMGMGTFRRVVPILYPLFTISPDADIGHTHNHLLSAGVDLGIPGLIAYLALWLGAGTMCWQVWHRSERADYRALALGLGAGMIAHFIWGTFDSNVLGSKAGFVFWLALGSIASLHQVALGHVILSAAKDLGTGGNWGELGGTGGNWYSFREH
ncbi:MAG: O-antigen ligase family protein [Ardenticatenaceae bacterium]